LGGDIRLHCSTFSFGEREFGRLRAVTGVPWLGTRTPHDWLVLDMDDALNTLTDRWRDQRSIMADITQPWTPFPIKVTISAVDYPAPQKIEILANLLGRLGSQVAVLPQHLKMSVPEIRAAAQAFDETDAHIIVLTRQWLECPWSEIELLRCIEDGIPTLAIAHADPAEFPAIRHCLRAIPIFDAKRGDPMDLRRKIADLVRLAHLHFGARNSH
jgi:hypothetical protein